MVSHSVVLCCLSVVYSVKADRLDNSNAKTQFASNVCERACQYGTSEQRSSIINEITTVGPEGTTPLQAMIKDQYANYVVQKVCGFVCVMWRCRLTVFCCLEDHGLGGRHTARHAHRRHTPIGALAQALPLCEAHRIQSRAVRSTGYLRCV
jgi:hypothetical protein